MPCTPEVKKVVFELLERGDFGPDGTGLCHGGLNEAPFVNKAALANFVYAVLAKIEEAEQMEVTEVRREEGKVTFTGQGKIVHRLAQGLLAGFRAGKGVNYIEIRLTALNPETLDNEPFVLTLQRENGKTPSQLQQEAEAQLAIAQDVIDADWEITTVNGDKVSPSKILLERLQELERQIRQFRDREVR